MTFIYLQHIWSFPNDKYPRKIDILSTCITSQNVLVSLSFSYFISLSSKVTEFLCSCFLFSVDTPDMINVWFSEMSYKQSQDKCGTERYRLTDINLKTDRIPVDKTSNVFWLPNIELTTDEGIRCVFFLFMYYYKPWMNRNLSRTQNR